MPKPGTNLVRLPRGAARKAHRLARPRKLKWLLGPWLGALHQHLRATFHNGAKRAIDIAGSLILLMLVAPLIGILAVLIKLQDGGPVFFRQKRTGMGGREFDFPKLRSMVRDAEQRRSELLARNDHTDSVTFKMRQDPRVTGVGRFMRRYSLDELPQLVCVLRGQMSLVGPRPPLPQEVAQYTLEQRRRLDAKPGLTCIWQVSGRGDIPFQQQVGQDIDYIETVSVWQDLRLLLLTVPAVLRGKGAY